MEKEIFRAGYWEDAEGVGRQWTLTDLDTIASKFNEAAGTNEGGRRVPLTIGHPEKSNAPAVGWVKRVWRNGDRLLAEFSDVFDKAQEWIKTKLFREVSVGLKQSLDLHHVALLGATPPAVAGLAEFQFEEAAGDILTMNYVEKERILDKMIAFFNEFFKKNTQKGDDQMDEAMKKANEDLTAKVAELTAANADLVKKFNEADAGLKTITAQVEAEKTARALAAEQAADAADLAFCDGLIAEKKMKPVDKPLHIVTMKSLRNAAELEFSEADGKVVKKTPLACYRESLAAVAPVVANGAYDKGSDATNKDAMISQFAEELLKNKKAASKSEAVLMVFNQHPELK